MLRRPWRAPAGRSLPSPRDDGAGMGPGATGWSALPLEARQLINQSCSDCARMSSRVTLPTSSGCKTPIWSCAFRHSSSSSMPWMKYPHMQMILSVMSTPRPTRRDLPTRSSKAQGQRVIPRAPSSLHRNWIGRGFQLKCGSAAGSLEGRSDRYVLAEFEHVQAIAQASGGECSVEGVAALAEVCPAFEVQGHDVAGTEDAGGLRGLGAGQGQVRAVEQGGAGRPGEQDRDIDRAEAVGDRVDMLQCRVVAADVHARQALAGEYEAGDRAGHRLASCRAVP